MKTDIGSKYLQLFAALLTYTRSFNKGQVHKVLKIKWRLFVIEIEISVIKHGYLVS